MSSYLREQDPYYGREDLVALAVKTVQRLFPASSVPAPTAPSASDAAPPKTPDLGRWFAYLLHRCDRARGTALHAVHLLRRVAAARAHPSADIAAAFDPSHRLYHHALLLGAYNLSLIYEMDLAYSNRSFRIAVKHAFTTQEIDAVQIALFRALGWTLRLPGEDLVSIFDEYERGLSEAFRAPTSPPTSSIVVAPASAPPATPAPKVEKKTASSSSKENIASRRRMKSIAALTLALSPAQTALEKVAVVTPRLLTFA